MHEPLHSQMLKAHYDLISLGVHGKPKSKETGCGGGGRVRIEWELAKRGEHALQAPL